MAGWGRDPGRDLSYVEERMRREFGESGRHERERWHPGMHSDNERGRGGVPEFGARGDWRFDPRAEEIRSRWMSDAARGGERGGERENRGPRTYARPDHLIIDDVCRELTYNAGIDASEIEVRCENGAVILAGWVSDRRDKRTAEDIAESCFGVRDVRNELRLRAREAA